MDLFTLIFIAVSLAMDAFAVSIGNSLCYGGKDTKKLLVSALFFGFFQMTMPIIGHFFGNIFQTFLQPIQAYFTPFVLYVLGIKMLCDILKGKDEKQQCSVSLTYSIILLQAYATSIDALAIGFSRVISHGNIFFSGLIIGLITTIICIIGLNIGKRFGSILGKRAELLGAIILIGIATKFLISAF